MRKRLSTMVDETWVAAMTPPGRGAIAVVEVSGPAANNAVDIYFRAANGKALAEQPIDRINFGRWQAPDAEGEGEELIVCRTGEDAVEVHCHGGDAAVEAIVSDLASTGCTRQSWQWVFSHQAHRIRGDAEIALAACTTERTAAWVLRDAAEDDGPLARAISEMIDVARNKSVTRGKEMLTELFRHLQFGYHLTEPWQIVLVGPPNVGKSSLINRLLGYERAIVFDQPGTTRDVVSARGVIDGWPVMLSDTAGLRATTDTIEHEGVKQARAMLKLADLVILVTAAGERQPESPLLQIGKLRPGQRLLWVANKCDRLDEAAEPPDGAIATSALTGQGVDQLLAAISVTMVPELPPPDAAFPFAKRQVESLTSISQSMDDAIAAGKAVWK